MLRNRALEIRKRLQLFGARAAAFGNAPARDARAQRGEIERFERAVVGERYVFRLWRMN
ncbi:MAG TPA: hypothetical protein VFW34_01085 [Candidatus Rubrimentiphilum sp.]|nr:hypothetical protein [Candidatus Rubrimentiphilum sp.]